jgi:hypothetical protein
MIGMPSHAWQTLSLINYINKTEFVFAKEIKHIGGI